MIFFENLRLFLKKIIAFSQLWKIPGIESLRRLDRLSKFGSWIRAFPKQKYFSNRFELYTFIQKSYIENRPIVYLEFGVYQGATIKYWSNLNKHKDSVFYGFDTFEELPEVWGKSAPVGTWSAQGIIPEIEDHRVSFVKGLFQETLDEFFKKLFIQDGLLVVNIDSDLYSSALFVLTKIDPFVKQGTLFIFDEINDTLHEFRALNDYSKAYRRNFELLATSDKFWLRAFLRVTK
jgi:O-methyltransferase